VVVGAVIGIVALRAAGNGTSERTLRAAGRLALDVLSAGRGETTSISEGVMEPTTEGTVCASKGAKKGSEPHTTGDLEMPCFVCPILRYPCYVPCPGV
jgi:hypothetical protein